MPSLFHLPGRAFAAPALRACFCALLLAGCGGGGEPAAGAPPSGDPPGNPAPPPPGDASRARALAGWAGKPARLLLGLGSSSAVDSIRNQGLRPDIYNAYLVGVGGGSWVEWNQPAGEYVLVHAAKARDIGAVPMFTLYQMASNGDGNLAGINQDAFMRAYWDNVRLMFRKIAASGTPSFVVLEPDFWGYAQHQSPGGDPARLPAKVAAVNADCAGLPEDVIGLARCLVRMRDLHAPAHAKVGFMPSAWGAPQASEVVDFMLRLGADAADFVAVETSDRDAGCFELRANDCQRDGTGWYWDAAAYDAHFARARMYRDRFGVPLIWWQTPMGVPADAPGGTPQHYRDNRMQTFLAGPGPARLVAAGGLGVVFSQGHLSQTGIDSDGGQYQRLSTQYLANPAPLP